jgi:hypothetical protein
VCGQESGDFFERVAEAQPSLQPRRQQVEAHTHIVHPAFGERPDGLFRCASLLESSLHQIQETTRALLPTLPGADRDPNDVKCDGAWQQAGRREHDTPTEEEGSTAEIEDPRESRVEEVLHVWGYVIRGRLQWRRLMPA